MTNREIKMEASWLKHLQPEFELDYMVQLRDFLQAEKQNGEVVFPKGDDIFNAFSYTPMDNLKVVILGQDPYHGPGQAHGLSFSVPEGIKVPPSLVNIYKEINRDMGLPIPQHGFLESWAKQGVLLLNSVLTVRQAQAASHQKKGWEEFTDKVIEVVNHEKENIVFLLWGSYAQKKGAKIDRSKHLVLHAPHPSPLSAHRGFLGCGHFSETNRYLESKGISPIDWSV